MGGIPKQHQSFDRARSRLALGLFVLWLGLSVSFFIGGRQSFAVMRMPDDGGGGGSPVKRQPTYGEPLPGLSATERQRFFDGKRAFQKSFEPSEGRGPILNSVSCAACHLKVGIGIVPGGASAGLSNLVRRFGRDLGEGQFDPLESLGGSLLNVNSIDFENCREGIPAEANVTAMRAMLPVFGFGLFEAIRDSSLLARVTTPPPGVSGRAHMVVPLEDPKGSLRVGRFGWKAQMPTLLSFSADASLQEMGITSSLLPVDNHPNVAPGVIRPECDDGVADPEDNPANDPQGIAFIQRVTDYMRFSAPPPQAPQSGMSGEAIFAQIGCANCHVPSFVTSTSASIPWALRGKRVKVYSDFLLHDMGSEADQIGQGQATPTEMRTTPLIYLLSRANNLGINHDDSVFGFGSGLEAGMDLMLTKHRVPGSEAQASANAYFGLSAANKTALIAFLESLGRPDFDQDSNLMVDAADFNAFRACYSGPQGYSPDHPCAISDVDQNRLVDGQDAQTFVTAWPGAINDCQCNGTNDLLEILNGTAEDGNLDAIPDLCRVHLEISWVNVFEVDPGHVTISAMAFPARGQTIPSGRQVEFWYNFDAGQGTGAPLGAAVCLNLAPQTLLGTATTGGSGSASISVTVPRPPGATSVHVQAAIPGDGTNEVKSNVMSVEIP